LKKRREENTGGLFIIPDDGLLSHPCFWGTLSPPSILTGIEIANKLGNSFSLSSGSLDGWESLRYAKWH
jgi:hypothetical protein